MPVKSLLEFSVEKTAGLIARDELTDFHLPNDVSQLVIPKLFAIKPSTTYSENFFKRFHLTEMTLNYCQVLDILMGATQLEDLGKLKLQRLNHCGLVHIKQKLKWKKANFDILNLLELLIKPESRKKLQHLKLEEVDLDSSRRIMKKMSETFPNINTLFISKAVLSPNQLRILCSSFPKLTQLCIPMTFITNCNGISNLKNLKFLDVRSARFDNANDVKEILKCEKLQVLDIAGIIYECPSFTSYLACDGSLDELQCLDISFNAVSESQLLRLVETHPNLRWVSLIGTSLEKREQFGIDYPNIYLETVCDLESCLHALEHYYKNFQIPKVKHILQEIWHILKEKYDFQSEEMLKKTFYALIPTPKTIEKWEKVQEEAVACLQELWLNDRYHMFTCYEIDLLVDTLTEKCRYEWEEEHDLDPTYNMQVKIWTFFYDLASTPLSLSIGYKISLKAAWVVKNSHNVDSNYLTPLESAMLILSHCMDESENLVETLSEDIELQDRLLHLTECLNFRDNNYDDFYESLVKVTTCLLFEVEKDEKSSARIMQALIIWIKNLEQFTQNRPLFDKVTPYVFAPVWEDKVDSKHFFEWTWFLHLRNLMLSKHGRSAVIHLFVLIHSNECSVRKTTSKRSAAVDARYKEIMGDVSVYADNPDLFTPTNDFLDVFKLLIKHGKRGSKVWAQWILSHFEGVEEPRAKRMRTGSYL